jgi:hypothetical protein
MQVWQEAAAGFVMRVGNIVARNGAFAGHLTHFGHCSIPQILARLARGGQREPRFIPERTRTDKWRVPLVCVKLSSLTATSCKNNYTFNWLN